jgi:hypothetical protein
MSSAFGWLDTDNEQRRKMLEVVDLFKEEGTVDELGIGSIRDALADALFPGTSVLHSQDHAASRHDGTMMIDLNF